MDVKHNQSWIAVALAAAIICGCDERSSADGESPTSGAQETTSSADERIYWVGGEVQPPIQIGSCDPEIPESLRQGEPAQAIFVYEVVVDTHGDVQSLDLVRREPAGTEYDQLEALYREALLACRFQPGFRGADPVRTRFMMTVTPDLAPQEDEMSLVDPPASN